MSITANVNNIRDRLTRAAQRAARNPADITLMAVTKTIPSDRIREAYDAGIRVFGENRVQEFATKFDALRDVHCEWHMIGHLQSNKASKALELFGWIDSVDSLKLAAKLNAAAAALGKRVPILIEINIGGENAKSGVTPDSDELQNLLIAAPHLRSLEFCGLMTVPPYNDDPEKSRPYFRQMRELFASVSKKTFPTIETRVLSMGMSHDFEIAIEEGSTCVRVGTAIFGERPK